MVALDGSVKVDALARALLVDVGDIMSHCDGNLDESGYERFEVWGNRIRATHRHSLQYDVGTPLSELYDEDGLLLP